MSKPQHDVSWYFMMPLTCSSCFLCQNCCKKRLYHASSIAARRKSLSCIKDCCKDSILFCREGRGESAIKSFFFFFFFFLLVHWKSVALRKSDDLVVWIKSEQSVFSTRNARIFFFLPFCRRRRRSLQHETRPPPSLHSSRSPATWRESPAPAANAWSIKLHAKLHYTCNQKLARTSYRSLHCTVPEPSLPQERALAVP